MVDPSRTTRTADEISLSICSSSCFNESGFRII